MTNRNLLKILFVEDTLSDVDLAVLELKKEKLKFDYTAVYTRSGLLKALKDFKPDLIISDYSMPQFNGLQAISLIKKFSPEIPVILFTGSINEETAVECLKAGAVDYVIKEHMKRLPFAVKEAMEQVSKQKEKKASELLLKESEEKLQSIFSAAPVGIGYIVDRVLIEINDAFCSITGYNRRELIGKSMEFLYPTKDEYEFIGREYRKITEKSKWSVETRIKCKSGKILNVIMNGSPLNKNDLSKGFTFTILDITARKQSEILLGESEERFRSLYNDAFSGLYRTNSKGEILLANRALIKMLGFQSFEELVARNLNDKGYEPSYLRQQFIDQIEKEGEVNNLESIWICHNGKEIFVRENAKAIYDSDGKILYYDGSVEDITERRKSENQQALVFLSLPLLIYYSETTNNYAATWISENVNRVTGFNRDVFLEKKNFWSGRLHPDDRDRVVRAFNELQESEKGEIEYRWQCANGEYHWFLDSYNSFKKNLQGKIEFIGVWIDITERKKVEEALQESEERYRMIVETAHDIVWMLDTQGCFIFINKRAEKITGHKISDWIGKSFVSLVHPEDLARVQEIFLATLRGKTQSFEVRIFSNTGEIIILSVNSVPISHGGIVTSTASFGRDITARKQTEEALKSSVSLLNASLESTADGILIVDGKGGIIKWNQKFSDMWGLSDELLNQHDDNAAINNILDKLIAPDEFL
ncbi:MAG: PAS domain S-box protein, partial [Bacteroidetes bacterium]